MKLTDDMAAKILGAAVYMLLNRKDNEGIVVKEFDKEWSVAIKEGTLLITESDIGCPDGTTITLHETKEDAIVAATLNNDTYGIDTLGEND